MMFQMMFAVITPALITGAFAERMKFTAFLRLLAPLGDARLRSDGPLGVGHGGWLRNLGALDFAGGTVVHITAGISALVAALVIGKRRGYGHQPMPPHNLPLTVLGAGLLWFGWFGFNAGSALAANGLAAQRLRHHQHRGRGGRRSTWMLVEWIVTRQADRARRGHRARWPVWSRSRRRPASSTPMAAHRHRRRRGRRLLRARAS